MPWFTVKKPDTIVSPALLFYPDRIKENILKMLEIAGAASRLRPHVKTYKCKEIVALQLQHGISKFKCATLQEALLLAQMEVPDVLLAYPISGPAIHHLILLQEKFTATQFSFLIDSEAQLKQWTATKNRDIPVFIDIDAGMHRTGCKPEDIDTLYSKVQKKGFTINGFHIYDGHLHEEKVKERQEAIDGYFKPLQKILQPYLDENPTMEVVCGGSITFPLHAKDPLRTLSPGTTLLWDHGYQSHFPDLPFTLAATILTRVIGFPDKNTVCLDVGHKAAASEMKEMCIYFPQLEDASIITHSEEHLVVQTSKSNFLKVGDVLYGIPYHICPTVALYDLAYCIHNGEINDQWLITARKRSFSIANT